MKKELSVKLIYDDFINKIILTDIEKEVLDLYIKGVSNIAMANKLSMGTATISRIIADLKDKYDNYKKLEIEKLKLFS